MSVKSNKICGVCGDKANIRNYGALTCEPCKAFFRRYVFRSESIKCSSNGGCIINLMTRGFCKKCRIDKCLAIGMRKEIIRTAEEKLRQRLLIEENRLKKQKLNECSDSVNSTTDSLIINSNDSQSIVKNDFIVELFGNTIEINDHKLQEQIIEIEKYITTNTRNIIKKISTRSPIMPIYKGLTDYKGLNRLEYNRINELLTTSQMYKREIHFINNTINDQKIYKVQDLKELDETTKTGHTVKTLIQYLKGLNGFTGMCSEDQLILVTDAYHEVNIMRCLMFYHFETRNFILKLIAILLFDPNRSNITHQQTIRLEQQLYIYLLQRYLLMKYGSEWESRLQKLMITLRDLQVMFELRRIYSRDENKHQKFWGINEFVRNAEENERIKHLIEENKRKRKECNECTDSVDSTTSPSNLSSDESLD
ncbi:unnamed protein product [Oppiella nova]|uniref:Nuclear receptor domain-containing protein n=1 Tax=Oppiella nova TaxID=334625 RepID=A0A7R9LG77_9ACAR|nr:unnamed protein product [Oppiella nova]CAG2163358.1 unnamed protein product [Oppiella nova]